MSAETRKYKTSGENTDKKPMFEGIQHSIMCNIITDGSKERYRGKNCFANRTANVKQGD